MVQRPVFLGGGLSLLLAFGIQPAFSQNSSSVSSPVVLQSGAVDRGTPREVQPSGYNFPPPSRGDRFARRGLDLRVGIRGWRQFGGLIKRQSAAVGIDPLVLGAYIWLESEFNPRQNYVRGRRRALGLGSVQAQDYPRYTRRQLLDPELNVKLTAAEFAQKWHPQDMVGTVMDVWYPAWRRLVARGRPVPVIKSPDVYTQAIANRYYALKEIDVHFPEGGREKTNK
ncbi:MAG: hypothetical protein VKN33_10750 [Candidatus Sericytochromatia bacterium]|nr:hypothetical protein [Candidatus Sericytochromatia bacterium]